MRIFSVNFALYWFITPEGAKYLFLSTQTFLGCDQPCSAFIVNVIFSDVNTSNCVIDFLDEY